MRAGTGSQRSNMAIARGSIVVGTDGSERAERAVDRAGELAKLLEVKVHVVSAYSKSSDALSGASGHEEKEDRTRAGHYVERAQRRLAGRGVESETHVWLGQPADALAQIADEQTAQMIVIGNRGMTGARRVLGSVPNRVSHHAPCDVLIVTTD
jgi:nucleotide-binding universal stress UspA family protein